MVEFALVMPLFLAVIFGLVESALIASASTSCQAAASMAAHQVAIAGSSMSTIDQQAARTILAQAGHMVTVHITRIEIAQVDSQGNILRENRYDGMGAPVGLTGWLVSGRMSTASAPLYVMVRLTYTYQWITSFLGALGTTLTLQASATAIAPTAGG